MAAKMQASRWPEIGVEWIYHLETRKVRGREKRCRRGTARKLPNP